MRVAELRRRRAAAQLLVPGERAAADVVRRLLAVQAQDPRAARVALRARGAERVDESALVTTWLLRGTLHLVAVEDLGWLHALTGALVRPQTERRLAELGAAPARALRVIERALADGPRSRADLADRLRAAGLAAEGQIVPHLLGLAASRGTLVLAGDAYALTADVVPAARAAPDRDAALAELARRYLRGHGPATPDDLAAWSGLGLGDARRGFAAIAGSSRTPAAERLRDAPEPPRRLPPRLLPAFDPYLLGWRDRGFAVDAAHARDVHPGGGIIRAVALVNGRAAGTWKRGRRRHRGRAVRAAAGAGRRRAARGRRSGSRARNCGIEGRVRCVAAESRDARLSRNATQRATRPAVADPPSMPQFRALSPPP